MVINLTKKIWLICLCLISLSIAGCFHVPDKDWLPSRDTVDTWNVESDDEMLQAINSFKNWIELVSSQRDNAKDNKNGELNSEELNQLSNEPNKEIENTTLE